MSEFKVERGIAMPLVINGKSAEVVYPYDKMELGDSFLVKTDKKHMINTMCTKNKIWGERLGMKYVARSVEGGVRIWRTG